MNQPQTPPKFCKDCSRFIAPEIATEPPRCQAFPMMDVVMGERFYIPCHDVRNPQAPCGTDGKMFTPKSEPENVVKLN